MGNDIHQLMNLSYEIFCIFAMIDDYGQRTCRPGDSACQRNGYRHDIQRAFYSGYFHAHGLKSQVVFLPNVMVGSMYVVALSHNDKGMVNMSGIDEYLREILTFDPAMGGYPALYGDVGFDIKHTIIPRYGRPCTELQERFNKRMASVCVSIKHCFGLHSKLFKLFKSSHMLKIYKNGAYIHNLIMTSFLIQNCYQCMNHSFCMFDCEPPTIEDYLLLDEILNVAPNVGDNELGTVFRFN